MTRNEGSVQDSIFVPYNNVGTTGRIVLDMLVRVCRVATCAAATEVVSTFVSNNLSVDISSLLYRQKRNDSWVGRRHPPSQWPPSVEISQPLSQPCGASATCRRRASSAVKPTLRTSPKSYCPAENQTRRVK